MKVANMDEGGKVPLYRNKVKQEKGTGEERLGVYSSGQGRQIVDVE